jgi:hypothetical protein
MSDHPGSAAVECTEDVVPITLRLDFD